MILVGELADEIERETLALSAPVGVGVEERDGGDALRMRDVAIQIARIVDELSLADDNGPAPAAGAQRHNAELAAAQRRGAGEGRVHDRVDERRVARRKRRDGGGGGGVGHGEDGERHLFRVRRAAHRGDEHRVLLVGVQQALVHG